MDFEPLMTAKLDYRVIFFGNNGGIPGYSGRSIHFVKNVCSLTASDASCIICILTNIRS